MGVGQMTAALRGGREREPSGLARAGRVGAGGRRC